MLTRIPTIISVLLLMPQLHAQSALTGVWMLILPDSESELVLTAEGRRIQGEYDLLVDDPSLHCAPASASRIWANPNAPIKIEQSAEHIMISYELFDLRREIPLGDESVLSAEPSTRNLEGATFPEMGSSFARYVGDQLLIESRNHAPGYIRTSRGIPQSANTIAIEELWVEEGILHVRHTYNDDTLFEEPFVLEYHFNRRDDLELAIYNCTDADYDWFNELNATPGDN